MVDSLEYCKLFDWSLAPEEVPPEPIASAREAGAMAAFRHARAGRVAQRCAPWRLAQRLGWILRSPVEVTFDRLEEVQFAATHSEAEQILLEQRLDHVVERDGLFIGIRTLMPLRFYDFRAADRWEAMFLPNGERSLEWRLGLGLLVPEGWGLLVTACPDVPSALEVVPGILTAKQLSTMTDSVGVSIAVRPHREQRVRRGDPIARVMPIHLDALRWRLTEQPRGRGQ